MREQGFYSINRVDDSWEIFYAPNFVTFNSGLTLLAEEHEKYEYPIDGWYWFDNEEQAYIEFGIPLEGQ